VAVLREKYDRHATNSENGRPETRELLYAPGGGSLRIFLTRKKKIRDPPPWRTRKGSLVQGSGEAVTDGSLKKSHFLVGLEPTRFSARKLIS